MAIKSSRTLGDLCRQEAPIRDVYRILSVPQAMEEVGRGSNRKAYYVGVDRGGTRLFGVDGPSYLLAVSEKVYRAIGLPQ